MQSPDSRICCRNNAAPHDILPTSDKNQNEIRPNGRGPCKHHHELQLTFSRPATGKSRNRARCLHRATLPLRNVPNEWGIAWSKTVSTTFKHRGNCFWFLFFMKAGRWLWAAFSCFFAWKRWLSNYSSWINYQLSVLLIIFEGAEGEFQDQRELVFSFRRSFQQVDQAKFFCEYEYKKRVLISWENFL